jgi:hypothetical protein
MNRPTTRTLPSLNGSESGGETFPPLGIMYEEMSIKLTRITPRGLILRVFFAFALIAGAVLNVPFAVAQTVQDQCNSLISLTEEQKSALGIKSVEWKTSDGIINTPHCKILMVAGPGEFSSTGLLIDPNQKFPSAGILRVPECYNGTRALFFRPGSSFDLTQALNPAANFMLSPECMAVMNLWSPTTSTFSGTIEAFYLPPNNFRDVEKGLSHMMNLGRGVLSQYFGEPNYSYYHGASHGAVHGEVLAEFSDLAWINGWVLQAGGDGPFRELIRRLWSCQQDLTTPPVSMLTDVTYSGTCTVENMANEIGFSDPEYREEILNILETEGEEAALLHAFAYNITERNRHIQNDAEFTNPEGALQAKTILIHGLRDNTVSIDDTLRYYSKIISMGKQDLVRAYIGEILPHALPPIINITFTRRMIRWVEQGTEPGDVPFNIMGVAFTVQNCTDLGFENDPCACFDYVHGSTGCHEILGLPPAQ